MELMYALALTELDDLGHRLGHGHAKLLSRHETVFAAFEAAKTLAEELREEGRHADVDIHELEVTPFCSIGRGIVAIARVSLSGTQWNWTDQRIAEQVMSTL